MPLTYSKLKDAKLAEKAIDLIDGFGLYLMVHPKGKNTDRWVIALRI